LVAVIFDNFQIGEILGGLFGKTHHQDGSDREIGSNQSADAFFLAMLVQLVNIIQGKSAGANYGTNTMLNSHIRVV
jgi:hypothetical protein